MFKPYVKGVDHFPKENVVYWDFTPLLTEPSVRKEAIKAILEHYKDTAFTHVVAIEAKGFIIGSLLAHELHLPLVLVRKPGLTPKPVLSQSFVKEYGTAAYEIAEGRLNPGNRVLLVYDILAGPGATFAAVHLIRSAGAEVIGCAYVVELTYLQANEQLKEFDVYSLIKIDANDRDAIRNR